MTLKTQTKGFIQSRLAQWSKALIRCSIPIALQVRILVRTFVLFSHIYVFPKFSGLITAFREFQGANDYFFCKANAYKLLSNQVPSWCSPGLYEKNELENCIFTMLKWLKFDHKFESQAFQVNFDPLQHFNSLNNSQRHHYIHKSIP